MTTTPKQIAANQTNAQLSTGPRTAEGKMRSSRNHIVHGLFSKTLRFKNDRQRAEYLEMQVGLREEFAPDGVLQSALVDKIAFILWQESVVMGMLRRRIDNQRGGGLVAQLQSFAKTNSLLDKPIPKLVGNERRAPALECRELHLRFTKSHSENSGESASNESSTEDADEDRTEVEARLGPAVDTLLRCYTTLENTLDRTLRQLRELQQ